MTISKKRIWMSVLKKITEKIENQKKVQSVAPQDPIDMSAMHGFSASIPVFYNINAKEGDLFVSKPTSIEFPPVERKHDKVCHGCGCKLSLYRRVCSICEREFCRNCCVEKFLYLREKRRLFVILRIINLCVLL